MPQGQPTGDAGALRKALRHSRQSLGAAMRIHAAEQLATRLAALPLLPDTGYVAGYWAMDGELALHAWQLRLPAGLVYCLPVLDEQAQVLRFAPWRSGDPLVTNRYGIPEPDLAPESLLPADALGAALVPIVGFDIHCNRIGMGGGWYDRTFAFRRGAAAPPWLIGTAFECQRVDALAPQHWDVPMDAICTESNTYMQADSR